MISLIFFNIFSPKHHGSLLIVSIWACARKNGVNAPNLYQDTIKFSSQFGFSISFLYS